MLFFVPKLHRCLFYPLSSLVISENYFWIKVEINKHEQWDMALSPPLNLAFCEICMRTRVNFHLFFH